MKQIAKRCTVVVAAVAVVGLNQGESGTGMNQLESRAEGSDMSSISMKSMVNALSLTKSRRKAQVGAQQQQPPQQQLEGTSVSKLQ